MRHVIAIAVSSVVMLPLAASPAKGQAVCSAPHSGPVVGSGASAGTLAPRSGWAQISVQHQRTSTLFNPQTRAAPLILDGVASTSSIYTSAAIGVLTGLEIWGQIPVHKLRYSDNGGSRERSGAGDPRLSVRASSSLFGMPAPFAMRGGVKLPGSRFPIDATVIPLTEGQRDWELSLESWRVFGGGAVYTLGWIGYRWREANAEAGRKPGDELFVHAAVGGNVGRLQWDLGADLLRGAAPVQQGVSLPGARRELLQLQPTVGWRFGPGRAGASAQIPLAGRNLPASPGFSVGYLLFWNPQ